MIGNSFANHLSTNGYVHLGLTNASLFNPPGGLAPSLKIFRDVLIRDLEAIEIKKARLNKTLQEGLDSLCKNKELVIRPADKVDYLKEMHKIVDDTSTYTLLPNDPKNKFKRNLEVLVERGVFEGILSLKEKLFLIPKAPRTPTIYYLPKLHKDPVCPSGRPVVSGIDSITSRVGRYIDFYLQPLVQKIPSYVKDTRHIINILSSLSPTANMWMVIGHYRRHISIYHHTP